MNIPTKTMMVLLAGLLTGCVSSQGDKTQIPWGADPRVGEEVTRVCFARNLDSWQGVDNDRDALILRMNSRESYKLRLSGVCDPDWARTTIAVITRPGTSCFTHGDKIKTDSDTDRGYGTACTIVGINRWNADAVKQTE